MSAGVPYNRTEPAIADVVIGDPARGKTWRELASLLNWCRGAGMHLIPAHNPSGFINSTYTNAPMYYRVEPEGMALARVWVLGIRQTQPTSGLGMRLRVTLPDLTQRDVMPPPITAYGEKPYVFIEKLTAKSSGLQNLTLIVSYISGDGDAYVESVACFELPRPVLTLDSADRGVDLETERPGQPIYDGANQSLAAVVEHFQQTWPRRMLWQQSIPPLTVASASWTDLFVLPVPILPHKRGRTDTTAAVAWDVRAYASDGTTAGEVRITTGRSANTDTLTIAAGSTSETWYGPGEVTADCEVVTATDGLPGSSVFETVQIAVRRTAGSGNLLITSIAAWEADPTPHFRITTDGDFREDDVGDLRITAD